MCFPIDSENRKRILLVLEEVEREEIKGDKKGGR